MSKTLMENIEAFIVEEDKHIKYGSGDNAFEIEINENININLLC